MPSFTIATRYRFRRRRRGERIIQQRHEYFAIRLYVTLFTLR